MISDSGGMFCGGGQLEKKQRRAIFRIIWDGAMHRLMQYDYQDVIAIKASLALYGVALYSCHGGGL